MKKIKARVLVHRADGTADELRFETESEARNRWNNLRVMASRNQLYLGRKIESVSWAPVAQRVGRGSWA